jgi:hypothetical protein
MNVGKLLNFFKHVCVEVVRVEVIVGKPAKGLGDFFFGILQVEGIPGKAGSLGMDGKGFGAPVAPGFVGDLSLGRIYDQYAGIFEATF